MFFFNSSVIKKEIINLTNIAKHLKTMLIKIMQTKHIKATINQIIIVLQDFLKNLIVII
jgi:hypothetical protein